MSLFVEMMIDLFFDVVVEGFVYFGSLFLPKDSTISEKARHTIGIVACIVSLIFIVLMMIGVGLLVSAHKAYMLGWVFIGLGVLFVLSVVVLKMLSYFRKKR